MGKTVIQFLSSLGDGGAETLVKDYALMMPADIEVKIVTVYPPSTHSVWKRRSGTGTDVGFLMS